MSSGVIEKTFRRDLIQRSSVLSVEFAEDLVGALDGLLALLVVDKVDEDQERDVEVYLGEERGGAGLAPAGEKAGVKFGGAGNPGQQKLLGLLQRAIVIIDRITKLLFLPCQHQRCRRS